MAVSSSSNSKRHTGHLSSLGGSADQESCDSPTSQLPLLKVTCPNLAWKTEGPVHSLAQEGIGGWGEGEGALGVGEV